MSNRLANQPWWLVARREIMVKLSSKAFWISTLSVVVIMGIAFGLGFLLASDNDQITVGVDSDDAAQIVALANETASTPMETLRKETADIESSIEQDRVQLGLVRADDGWQILVDSIETSVDNLETAATTWTLRHNAEELGVDSKALYKDTSVDVRLAGEKEAEDAIVTLVAGMIFAIAFFMSAMTYGAMIAQSVAEEKESRIVEILAAAIPTRHLLIGKTVGNTIMALGQIALFAAAGMLGIAFSDFSGYLPLLAPNLGWFILFFLVGFAALATLWAAAGAMVSRVQDVSQSMTPLFLLLMIAYMTGLVATGSAARVLSYVPVISSVIMPQRLLEGDATWVSAVISLLICIVFMGISIRVGELVYRRGLLKTSGILKLKEVFSRQ